MWRDQLCLAVQDCKLDAEDTTTIRFSVPDTSAKLTMAQRVYLECEWFEQVVIEVNHALQLEKSAFENSLTSLSDFPGLTQIKQEFETLRSLSIGYAQAR